MPGAGRRRFLGWAAVQEPADPLHGAPATAAHVAAWRLGRRRFLIAGAGATAALLAGCSTSGDDTPRGASDTTPSGTDPTPAGTEPPATTVPPPPDDASPADTALVSPGSPGLVDEATYQQRADEFLEFATGAEPTGNPAAIVAHLVRSRRDPSFTWAADAVTVESLGTAFAGIDDWRDDRAADVLALLWIAALGSGADESGAGDAADDDGSTTTEGTSDASAEAATVIGADVIAAIDERLVANRYRADDSLPGDRVDDQWYWSEHQRITTLAVEHLAGRRLPDTTFTVSGRTGADHADRARDEIFAWVDERAELGFFEWHSDVALHRAIAALTALVELSDDPDIVVAAALALDACLVDLAAHHHAGCLAAPRATAEKQDSMTALTEDTWGVSRLVFADTSQPYQSMSDLAVTTLCAARRYRPPQLVVDVALDDQPAVVRERHGVYLDGSAPVNDAPEVPEGRAFDDPANVAFWWSAGAIDTWQLADVTVATADEFRLWDTTGFARTRAFAERNDFDAARLATWAQARSAIVSQAYLGEANTYLYRDDKVALATVADHRFGELRDSIQSWRAVIDERAIVFTNHPTTDAPPTTIWDDDATPGYWTGEASVPRSAQFRQTAIHIYQPRWDESTDPDLWATYGYRPFTHAYVPQDHFDEVRQIGNWTVVARGGGYIALWSWRTPTWREYDPTQIATNGMTKPFDLVADGGPDNVWIVEVGSDAGGAFDDFAAAVTAIDPSVVRDDAGFTVSWTSPSSGLVDFGSTGAFMVEGEPQPLEQHPRHESPWGIVEHGSRQYNLVGAASTWSADFAARTRAVS